MVTLELVQVGDAIGVILPDEVLSRLQVESGDTLYWSEIADGVTLSVHKPESEMKTD